jgi:hypothetical protein
MKNIERETMKKRKMSQRGGRVVLKVRAELDRVGVRKTYIERFWLNG